MKTKKLLTYTSLLASLVVTVEIFARRGNGTFGGEIALPFLTLGTLILINHIKTLKKKQKIIRNQNRVLQTIKEYNK